MNITTESPPTTTTPSAEELQREAQYESFNSSALSPDVYAIWILGTPCVGAKPARRGDHIFCPMPFEYTFNTECCPEQSPGGSSLPRCCIPKAPAEALKWLAGVGAILVLCFIALVIYRRWYGAMRRRRTMLKYENMTGDPTQRYADRAADRKPIYKTDKYVVHQAYEEVIVTFKDDESYRLFKTRLLDCFTSLRSLQCVTERQTMTVGRVVDSRGLQLHFTLNDELRVIVIGDDGALAWAMRDFQSLCKDIKSTPDAAAAQATERRSPVQLTKLRTLLPTADVVDSVSGEAKCPDAEIEVKFDNESQIVSFKDVLGRRYPNLSWTRYLERETAWIQLTSGGRVSVSTWKRVSSIWLAGTGHVAWFNGQEFNDISYEAKLQAAIGTDPDVHFVTDDQQPLTGSDAIDSNI